MPWIALLASVPWCPAPVPASAQEALTVGCAGLEALLPDPRDAGLRRAVEMLGERLVELSEEASGNGLSLGAGRFLLELADGPLEWTLPAKDGKQQPSGEAGLPSTNAGDRDLLPAGLEPVLSVDADLDVLWERLVRSWRGAAPRAEQFVLADGGAGRLAAALGFRDDHLVWAARLSEFLARAESVGIVVDQPLGRDDLALLPADCMRALLFQANVGALVDEIAQRLAGDSLERLAEATEIDLRANILDHLGTTVGLYGSEATGGSGLFTTVAFVTVAAPEKLGDTLRRLAARLATPESRVRVRAWTHGGVPCQSWVFPGLPVPFEPSLALEGGLLLVAACPGTLTAALDQRLKDGPTLLESPRFQRALPRPPEGLVALHFRDDARLLRDGYGASLLLCNALANAVRSPAGAPERDPGLVLPPYAELAREARPSLTVAWIDDGDLRLAGTADRSLLVNLTGAVAHRLSGAALFSGLATVVVPNVLGRLVQAQVFRATADIQLLEMGVRSYALENSGRYPESLEELITPDEAGLQYLDWERIPLDPWGHEYVYEKPADAPARVLSLGADGRRGGEGKDADIGRGGVLLPGRR